MKVKTSELIGDALNWAVATALGKTCFVDLARYQRSKSSIDNVYIEDVPYSTSWELSGPILEEEGIQSTRIFTNGKMAWQCSYYRDGDLYIGDGPSLLIAGMRCLVASILDDEVDVPDILVPKVVDPNIPVCSISKSHLKNNPEHWCKEVLLYSPNNPDTGKEHRVNLYAKPTLTREQIDAIKMVLNHYKDDIRIATLISLVKEDGT